MESLVRSQTGSEEEEEEDVLNTSILSLYWVFFNRILFVRLMQHLDFKTSFHNVLLQTGSSQYNNLPRDIQPTVQIH